MIISLIGFGAILILAFMRMPLGFALGLVDLSVLPNCSSYRAAISNAARLVIDSARITARLYCQCLFLWGRLLNEAGWRASYIVRPMCF